MKEKFFLFLEEVSTKLYEDISQNKRFLIITHIDADGLSSATLFLHYLYYNNAEVHLIYAKYLDIEYLSKLYKEYPEDVFVFLDLGSGIIDKLKNIASKKTYIFDHHDLTIKDKIIGNITQVNPRIFGYDGSLEISTSGIIYYLLKEANHSFDEISFLGLVGAIGDMQEKDGFFGLNKKMLEELQENGIILVKKGLKLFGLSSKPLYKAIQFSAEVYIPGITGDEEQSIQLLNNLRIPLKKRGTFTTYLDLTEDEQRRLISEIIKIRIKNNIPDAENVIGNLYILNDGFYFKELREIAYVFNAAGRLLKPARPIAYFLGDKRYLDSLQDIIIDYKKILVTIIQKIYNGEVNIEVDSGITMIDLSNVINLSTITSPIASLLINSEFIKTPLLVVLAIDESNNSLYKISVRAKNGKNLSKVVRLAAEKVGGFGGGHDAAAGAIIPKDKLKEFVKYLKIYARQESILV